MEPFLGTPPGERIEAMDVLRGFALLGILLVNVLFFAAPAQLNFMRAWSEIANPWLMGSITFLVQGKFYCLFSFLFGAGFALQTDRLEGGGQPAGRVYARRLVILLGIGLLHGTLVWMGDILAVYALMGFLLLAFRKRSGKTLLIWVAALLGCLSLLFLLLWGLMSLVASMPQAAAALAKAAAEQKVQMTAEITMGMKAYGSGPYGLLFSFRLKELLVNYLVSLLMFGPQFLAMFLLGVWSTRRGIFRDPESHLRLIRWVGSWGLVLGLLGNAWYAWVMGRGTPGPGNPLAFLGFAVYATAAPLLSLAYAALLVLALRSGVLRGILQGLAAPGRMALSNYLTHSLVMTTLFYFYGGGLFGKLPLPWAYGVALLLYALLVPLSNLWLKQHWMGPMEWVWRRLTYGQALPFRRPR